MHVIVLYGTTEFVLCSAIGNETIEENDVDDQHDVDYRECVVCSTNSLRLPIFTFLFEWRFGCRGAMPRVYLLNVPPKHVTKPNVYGSR